jgi:hypothetical protein
VITFEHIEGVGMRAKYRVRKDGKHVAILYRFGVRSGWELYSVHYGLTLASGFRSIDQAREAAQTIEYPTAQEAYETTAKMIEPQRRFKLEAHYAKDFIRLARELVAGSNSARMEMERLVAEIDARTVDRSDIHSTWRKMADEHFRTTNTPLYRYDGDVPFYPEPPVAAEEKAA